MALHAVVTPLERQVGEPLDPLRGLLGELAQLAERSHPGSGSPTQTYPRTSWPPERPAVNVASRGAVRASSRQPANTSAASSAPNESSTETASRPDRVQAKLELGDDAEVATAAAQPPEQIRTLLGADVEHVALGGHEFVGEDVVAGQPVAAGQPTHAATEGETADASVRDVARGGREAMGLSGAIEAAEQRSPWTRARRRAGSIATEPIGRRSIIRPPSGTDSPAMLWPPQRTPISSPDALASRTAARTSATPAHGKTAAGKRSTIEFHTVRASS